MNGSCSFCGKLLHGLERLEGVLPGVGSLEFCSAVCHNAYHTAGGVRLPEVAGPEPLKPPVRPFQGPGEN